MPRVNTMPFTLGAGLLALLLCAPAQATVKLTLCFENRDVLPWRSMDLEGLNFDLLKRIEPKLNLTLQYQPLPWKRCLAKLKNNEVDGAFSVSYSADRRAFGAYPGRGTPEPEWRMHTARYYLMRKKGNPIDWDGTHFSNVDGKIGFQLGYSVGEMLRAQNVQVDESKDTIASVARKLLTGRLAGAAVFDSEATALMTGPLGTQLEMIPIPLLEKPYFLMLSNRLVKSDPDLAERIWKAVEEVRNGREYGKLVQEAGAENAR
ncbi:MAG TPA: transporter substrate-binding domain-containing protein [Telluria sp.]|nr:transporter substrate-binding domain-containing protein [Telluria sp.]